MGEKTPRWGKRGGGKIKKKLLGLENLPKEKNLKEARKKMKSEVIAKTTSPQLDVSLSVLLSHLKKDQLKGFSEIEKKRDIEGSSYQSHSRRREQKKTGLDAICKRE